MRKHLNNPFVSGGLALLAVVLVYQSLSDRSPSVAAGEPTPAYDQEELDPEPVAGELRPLDPAAIHGLAGLEPVRDAFSPPSAEAPTVSAVPVDESLESEQVTLQGLWIQGEQRFAVLDHRVVAAGDAHKRLRVESISDEGVRLSSPMSSRLLLPGESWTYQYKRSTGLANHDPTPAVP